MFSKKGGKGGRHRNKAKNIFFLIVAGGYLTKLTVEIVFIGYNAAQGSGRLRRCWSRSRILLSG